MPAVQHRHGQEVHHREVHRDHAQEDQELPEVLAGDLVRHVRDGERAAHRLHADAPADHRVEVHVHFADEAHGAAGAEFHGVDEAIRLLLPRLGLQEQSAIVRGPSRVFDTLQREFPHLVAALHPHVELEGRVLRERLDVGPLVRLEVVPLVLRILREANRFEHVVRLDAGRGRGRSRLHLVGQTLAFDKR